MDVVRPIKDILRSCVLYCPKCGSEYREGFYECVDCKVKLTENPPQCSENQFIELVTVLETGDSSIIPIAKNILEDAGIKYFAKGEGLQHLFAFGRVGTGFNPIVGPIRLQVGRPNYEEAKVLLDDIINECKGIDNQKI